MANIRNRKNELYYQSIFKKVEKQQQLYNASLAQSVKGTKDLIVKYVNRRHRT